MSTSDVTDAQAQALNALGDRVLAVAEETLAQMINELNAGSMGDLNRHLARIDVPRASVVLIEAAERFGLSQLHQIRGRVGRWPHQAYCILMSDGAHTDKARRRLQVMTETTDGFAIATADLELRGEGDVLGTRLAGMPEFRVADLFRDAAVLETAKQDAMSLIREDPALKKPEHQALRTALRQRWSGRLESAEPPQTCRIQGCR